MQYLNFVLFTIKEREVRVKHVILPILILLLLLLLCKCSGDMTDRQKEVAIDDVCAVSNTNLDALNLLLQRSDICSEEWFDDVDSYVKRLKDQNSLLEDKEGVKDKQLYQMQEDIIDALEVFEKKQDDVSIDALEKLFEEYQTYYHTYCEGEA